MLTIQVSEQTKQDLDDFKEKYGHTSIDSVIKVLFSLARAEVEANYLESIVPLLDAISTQTKMGPDPIFESLAPNEILIMNYLPKTEEYEVATNVGGSLKIERVHR